MLTGPAAVGGLGVGLADGVLSRSVGEVEDAGAFVAVDAGLGVVEDPDVDEDPPVGVSLHPTSALNSRSTPTTLTIRR
jgi:hypothetical protein